MPVIFYYDMAVLSLSKWTACWGRLWHVT